MLCPTIAPADVEARIALATASRAACTASTRRCRAARRRARDGTMSLMVACDRRAVRQRQRACSTRSPAHGVPRSARALGDGARTKLVNNLLAAINLAGAAEALALAERLGLDPAPTLDVIEQSSGQSWIGTDRMRRALGRRPGAARAHDPAGQGLGAGAGNGAIGACRRDRSARRRPSRFAAACDEPALTAPTTPRSYAWLRASAGAPERQPQASRRCPAGWCRGCAGVRSLTLAAMLLRDLAHDRQAQARAVDLACPARGRRAGTPARARPRRCPARCPRPAAPPPGRTGRRSTRAVTVPPRRGVLQRVVDQVADQLAQQHRLARQAWRRCASARPGLRSRGRCPAPSPRHEVAHRLRRQRGQVDTAARACACSLVLGARHRQQLVDHVRGALAGRARSAAASA